MARFKAEILAMYEPPARAKNSWFKVRQVVEILESIGCKLTADLTPACVMKFVGTLNGRSPETVKGLIGYLSPVCKYAKAMGYLKISPFEIRKDWYSAPEPDDDGDDDDQGDEQKHLSIDRLSRLLEHLESQSATWKGARLYALVATMAYTGLRRNEGLTRAVADFDLDRRIVRVKARRRRLKTAASGQPVGLPKELVPILAAWLPRTGSKWAFPGVKGKSPWTGGPTGGRPLDELKQAGRDAGVGDVTFLALAIRGQPTRSYAGSGN